MPIRKILPIEVGSLVPTQKRGNEKRSWFVTCLKEKCPKKIRLKWGAGERLLISLLLFAYFLVVYKRNHKFYLNPASVEFAEDARRQERRRTTILQVLANTADSVKSALLKGKLFPKITIIMAASN